jgi:DNA-binding beta-propeller fold protein YncE
VQGRIDHLAIDPAHARLAIAELENNSIDVVDIASGSLIKRIEKAGEPQGVAFDQTGGLLLAASRSDGALRVYDAATFETLVTLPLGEDADNVRIDPRNGHAIVGYGDGALAVVDLRQRTVLARIALPAHPESIQIDAKAGKAFVNLPDARTIGVVDIDTGALADRWSLPLAMWNYPMALDPSSDELVAVFRGPAQIVRFDRATGKKTASAATCGDADDVFYDAARSRIYVACGAGGIDVFETGELKLVSHAKTPAGARTALFDPLLNRLFVAARSPGAGKPASLLVLKPVD